MQKLGCINEWSLNFLMDGVLTTFWLFELFLFNGLMVHCIIIKIYRFNFVDFLKYKDVYSDLCTASTIHTHIYLGYAKSMP